MFCDLGHLASLKFAISTEAKSTGMNVSNEINAISYTYDMMSTGGTQAIIVHGYPNTSYEISVTRSSSTSSYSPATSGAYYNFNTSLFQNTPTTFTGTTDSKGKNRHYLKVNPVIVDTKYHLVLGSSGSSTLKSSVPTVINQAVITQHGLRTLTIESTRVNASKYGLLPSNSTVIRRSRYDGNPYTLGPTKTIHGVVSKACSASTRVVLTKSNKNIEPGMIVTIPFQGNGVAHNTTVSSVKDNIVTLSANATIAANTNIRFDSNSSVMVPFSFRIQTRGNTLSFGASQITSSSRAIYGLSGVTEDVADAGCANSTTVNMETDDLNGIMVGMEVRGPGVTGGTTVTAINRGSNSFTASLPVTVPAVAGSVKPTTLTFTRSSDDEVGDVSLIHAQATIDTTAFVTGYLEVRDIANDTTVSLVVDNIVGTT